VTDEFPAEAVEAAAAILQALALPLRLRIVVDVIDREASADELAERMGANYRTLAQHLRHLRIVGVLQRRRHGNRVVYRAAPFVVGLVREAVAAARTTADPPQGTSARPRH